MSTIASCLGALALELTPGCPARLPVIGQAAGGELSSLIARDLARHVPEAEQLDLAVLTALFDPVELLRAGWPLHRELERLIAQAPGAGEPRIIAIAGSEGALPTQLQPDPGFAGGALRLLPLVLRGDATVATRVGAALESVLLDVGMAGADTALLAQTAFGARIEHARYLTLHDLAAMMAMQYENVGLGSAWPLIEAALLAPGQQQWLDSPPEPLILLSDGEAHIALLDPETWARSGLAPADASEAQLARAFDFFQSRQRQLASLLQAHGIPVSFDYCRSGADPRVELRR